MTDKHPDLDRRRARAISDVVSECGPLAMVVRDLGPAFCVTTLRFGGAFMQKTRENRSLDVGDVFLFRDYCTHRFNQQTVRYVRDATDSEREQYFGLKNLKR
ncbi:hypothetical protein HY493_02625 [Candidatus Woesearchaeota archaeon]|nr:hypothetical protein [Candidatus Woesearchaeota archaeon]